METATTPITVEVKLRNLDDWQARVEAATEDYASDEWKARARARIERNREVLHAVLDAHGNIVLPSHRDVAYGDATNLLDDDMRWAVLWQYRRHLDLGTFIDLLIQAADAADGANLDRLALGYPALVSGIRRWRNEPGFADEVRCLLADG